MDKFLAFLKKHWLALVISIVVVLFAVAGIPLLINWAFSKPAWCDFFAVDWVAKDALAYYGNALGFIGTVIFSGLALWQNHVIKEANDKHTTLLEQMETIKNAPHIVVHSILAYGKTSKLKIQVKNTSENIAEQLYASGFAIIDETGAALWRDDEVITLDYLSNDRKFEIGWDNPEVESDKHQFVFDLKYNDKFGGNHTCKAVGAFENGKGLPRFKLTEL